MRRLLAVAALVAGTLATSAPAAQACAYEHCPWGRLTCQTVGLCEIDPEVPQCLLVAQPYACLP